MSPPEGPDVEVLAKLANVHVEDVSGLRVDLARLMQLVDRLQGVEADDAEPVEAAPTRRADTPRAGRGRAVLTEARQLDKDHIVVDKR